MHKIAEPVRTLDALGVDGYSERLNAKDTHTDSSDTTYLCTTSYVRQTAQPLRITPLLTQFVDDAGARFHNQDARGGGGVGNVV